MKPRKNVRKLKRILISFWVFWSCMPTVSLGQIGWCKVESISATSQVTKESKKRQRVGFREVVTIPVVVHVVWKDKADSLSYEQISSQIEALNRDYRLKNEHSGHPYEAIAADMEIEFCLAQRDPNGNSTNGVNYVRTAVEKVGCGDAIYFSSKGGSDAWEPESYLNIWVGELCSGIAGKASFPGEGNPEQDGVVVQPKRFGTIGTVQAPYDLGRTATHEVGHYFNLLHLWGPCDEMIEENGFACCANLDADCNCDDGVADTPLTTSNYLNRCLSVTNPVCGRRDMPMNFMTFSDDACMALFTQGQKARAWETLLGARSGLLSSFGCAVSSSSKGNEASPSDLIIYPNPVRNLLHIRYTFNRVVRGGLYNLNGSLVKKIDFPLPTTIDVTSLPGGVYLLKLRGAHEFLTKKLIIEH